MARTARIASLLPVLLMTVLLLAAGCGESLPTRIVPEGALAVDRVLIGQGTGDLGIEITVDAFVRNNYDETFEGRIELRGEAHIWWKNRPEIEATLPVEYSQEVRLNPGQTFRVEWVWFMQTDDGTEVLPLLNYSDGDVRFGIIYARPETFVCEVRMTAFEETGLLTWGPQEFTLTGWRWVEDDDAPSQKRVGRR